MRPDRRPSGAAIAFVAGWLLISGGLALAIAPRAIGHDQASLLDSGRRIAGGEVPFRDILDINSPVVYYLNAVPAGLAAATGTNAIPWFTVLVLLLSAWSALLADRAFLAMAPQARWVERLAVMLVPLGPATFHLTNADPGQREHLFVLLYFPFLMYRVAAAHGARVGSTAGRFALGAVAAIGVGLKPHFLLPVLAAEAGLLLTARSPRLLISAEVAGALSTAAACAAAMLMLPLDARSILTGQILPLVTQGYGAYDTAQSVLLVRATRRILLALVLAGVAWREGPSSLRPPIVALTAFCLGAIASTVVQAKGFGYHYLPADAALLYLAAAAALGLARGRATGAVRAAVGVAIVVGMCAWRPIYAWQVTRPDAYPFRSVIEQYTRPGDKVIVLSTSSAYAFPATLQLDRIFVSRQSALFLVLARTADAARGGDGARTAHVLEELADEIRMRQPAAVFIDRNDKCQACPPGFSVAVFLEADPRIQAALASYRLEGVAQDVDVFLKRAR